MRRINEQRKEGRRREGDRQGEKRGGREGRMKLDPLEQSITT